MNFKFYILNVSLISETFLGPESHPCLAQNFRTGWLLEANDRLSKPPKPNKNAPKGLMYWAFMKIITKTAFISIQTLRQTISNSLQTLCKAHAHALQTICKLFSNALQTPLKRFQTLWKLLPNPFKCFTIPFKSISNFFQTLCKRLANAIWGCLKHPLAQIEMFNKMCFPMEGHNFAAHHTWMLINLISRFQCIIHKNNIRSIHLIDMHDWKIKASFGSRFDFNFYVA